jgi:hypothetical protein
MPRRPANVNQTDVQRVIRACQREKVAFRLTLQPNGAAVFEAANMQAGNLTGKESAEQQAMAVS